MNLAEQPDRSGFRLNKADGKFMGVCAGLADRFGWSTLLIRLTFVAATLLGLGSPILIYLAIGLIAN